MIDLTKYKKGAKFVTNNGYIAEMIGSKNSSCCFMFRLEKQYEPIFYHTLYVAYNRYGQEIKYQCQSFDIIEELKI